MIRNELPAVTPAYMADDAISDRQALIAERVRQRGFQTIAELAAHFEVTGQTIRRDVHELSERGILKRRHGGVELPEPTANLSFADRQILNLTAKEQIAQAALKQIPNGASLAVSIGTTPEIVVRHLTRHRDMKVFTNNIMAALSACTLPDAEVHIPGGMIRPGARDLVGPAVEAFFARYKVDIGIYGVGGVDTDGGLLDFHEDEVRVREAIRLNCRKSFLLLDATKFGRAAHVRGGHIADADVVFSDYRPPHPVAESLAKAGRNFVLCGAEEAA